ncbi:twin-arginine translocase subunit TatC, partial [Candidatus Bipolaricaulota bacterium]|nr:twin-arginine translocase subunit TatC [Candidatus Bipolaricaulota bacterium]
VVRLGFVKLSTLRKNRRFVIVGTFIVAAFITPTDLFSQAFMAVPLVMLYELTIRFIGLALEEELEKEKKEEA